MFEKEIKFISDFCLNKVKGLGTFFTYEKLAATDLHPAILRYISAELDYMIYADRKKLLQQSYFDYSGKEIFQRFNEISNEIKKTKKISIEDVKKLTIQAVSFNANYVVKPKWSLTKLIYHDLKYVSVDELEMMLNYIYYYDYIKNVLTAYLSKRKIVQLSATEFDLILNKIDRELFKSNTDQLIYNALKSIGDFFNIGGLDRSKVSPIAVEILLKEKNLINYLLKLQQELPAIEGVKKEYDIEEIQKILLSPAPVEPEAEPLEAEENIEIDDKSDRLPLTEDFVDENKSNTDELTEEVSGDETERKTLGQIADEHASELENSDISEFLNTEEEKLMEMYEKELNDLDEEGLHEEIVDESGVEDFVEEITEENIENTNNLFGEEEFENVTPDTQLDDSVPEKEIVDEMLDDYFGEQTGEEKQNEETDEQIDVQESSDRGEDENFIDDTTTNEVDIPKKINSLEDDLLEVFEDLDEVKNEVSLEKEIVEPDDKELSDFENEVIESVTSELNVEQELPIETELTGLDLNDNDLKIDDEATFADEEKADDKNEFVEDYEPGPEEVNNEIYPVDEEPEEEKHSDEDFIKRKNDLFSYMKRKEIKKITRSIFGGDEMDFVTTMEKISDCSTYREATEILKGVFFSYKISPFSKEAIMFTNAVSNYFRQA